MRKFNFGAALLGLSLLGQASLGQTGQGGHAAGSRTLGTLMGLGSGRKIASRTFDNAGIVPRRDGPLLILKEGPEHFLNSQVLGPDGRPLQEPSLQQQPYRTTTVRYYGKTQMVEIADRKGYEKQQALKGAGIGALPGAALGVLAGVKLAAAGTALLASAGLGALVAGLALVVGAAIARGLAGKQKGSFEREVVTRTETYEN